MERKFYIYILASKKDGILYIGITNNLERRMEEHKVGMIFGDINKIPAPRCRSGTSFAGMT